MVVWGYILQMPGRPKPAEQRQALSALGVDMGKAGTCWHDKLVKAKRHATAGRTQLEERNALLAAVQPGDRVIVCNPLCLGVSAQDAAWFIGQLAERGVSLLVNGDVRHIQPGDDPAELIADVAKAINRANVARSRGRS